MVERLFVETTQQNSTPISKSSVKNIPVLTAFKFFIHKTDKKDCDEVKKQVLDLGGSVLKKFEEEALAIVSTKGKTLKKCIFLIQSQ